MFCESSKDFPIFLNKLIPEMKRLLAGSSQGIDVEIKEHKNRRTSVQNSFYWVFNTSVAAFLNESGLTYGEDELPYNKDIIHLINKKVFGHDTTTKMSVGEFCDYITQLIMFWQERTNYMYEVPELPEKYMSDRGYTREYVGL